MSSSPFEIVRNNLKPLMVLLTLLAILSFVVLPVVDTYMRRQSGSGGNEVLASFDGIDLKRNRVEYFTRNHLSTIRFLDDLAKLTISRGGVPRSAGFQYDAQQKRILSTGISTNSSTNNSIRTLLFAEKARQAGFELDDGSLRRWLDQFTDGGTVSEAEAIGMLMQSTRNTMGRPHLYEQLRSHFLANVYSQRGTASLVSSRGELKTPDEQWRSFLKLNQNCTASTFGVLVADFIDETSDSPSESEIRSVYEAGKDIDPSDQSPEPGFHRPYTASFEYLAGDLQKFIDAEIEKLTEDELRAEYEKRIKGGDFVIPESLLSEDDDSELADFGDDEEESDKEEKEENGKQGDKPASETNEPRPAASESKAPEKNEDHSEAAQENSEQESPAEPTGEEQAEEVSGDKAETSEETVTEEPATEEPASETVEEAETDAVEEPQESPEPSTEDQSRTDRSSRAIRLVGFQDDADKDDNTVKDSGDESDESEEPIGESTDTPTEPATDATDKKDTADTSGEGSQSEAAASDESDQDQAAQSSETESTEDKNDSKDDSAADGKEEEKNEEPAEPKTRSFEEVRDEIARQLAEPKAIQAMDDRITRANDVMQKYSRSLAIYESHVAGGLDDERPARPDLKKLAEELGFEHEDNVGPMDAGAIADHPLGNSYDVGVEMFRRGFNFVFMMYGFNNGRDTIPPRPLFSVIRTVDDTAGKTYVVWKTQETEAYTPSLDEARDDVILAIRTKQARQLARAKAEEIAAKVNAGEKLADQVGEFQDVNLNESLPPFSWMQMVGRGQIAPGNIEQLDAVGDQFMNAAFSTEVGTCAVAPNQPESVFYVIQPKSFSPELTQLRDQFQVSWMRQIASRVPGDGYKIQNDFIESIEEASGFKEFEQQY